MIRSLLVIVMVLQSSVVSATILFSRIADNTGTPDAAVATSVWNYLDSSEAPNNRLYYRNDTPVAGHTLYFRNDAVNLQHDAWNGAENFGTINLTPGTTYWFGAFFRFDRINGLDVWRDTNGPNSYDKLLEFQGTLTIRWIILAGWPNSNYLGSYDGKFTFDAYSSPDPYCTNCGPNEKWANVSPYGQNNPYICDYGRWYAVVMSIKPSSGGAATDGLVELFINGTKTTSLAQKTQDSASPSFSLIGYSGTMEQPNYLAPAHYRKFDHVLFTDSLTDIQNAGLMSDPEAGGGPQFPPSSMLMFVEQGFLVTVSVLQYLMILVFLWKQRARVIQLSVAISNYYHKRSYLRSDSNTPMIESRGEVIDLFKKDKVRDFGERL